jgi:hypothetical protein
MLYKLEVVDLNLALVMVIGLSGDKGGVAPPLFLEREETHRGAPPLLGRCTTPLFLVPGSQQLV